ncbi:MAG: hypothetical protein OXJ64_19455, partial [Boseongicola sp.]|nr:hypothetical protein [Boseongicola sp.]
IEGARLGTSDFNLADYRPVDAPNAGVAEEIRNIDNVALGGPDLAGLRKLAKTFEEAGLPDKAIVVSATADRWDRQFRLSKRDASIGVIVSTWFQAWVLGWGTGDGTQPLKPFWLLVVTTLLFAATYWMALAAAKSPKLKYTIKVGDKSTELPIPKGIARTLAPAVMFSLATGALIAVRILRMYSVLDVASGSIPGLASYKAYGWVYLLAVFQVLATLSLLLLIWITR